MTATTIPIRSTTPLGVQAATDALRSLRYGDDDREACLRLGLALTRYAHLPLAWPLPTLEDAAAEVAYAQDELQRAERVEHEGACWQVPTGEPCPSCEAHYIALRDDALDRLIALVDRIAARGAA